jgi:hypothetical protein
MGSHTGTHVDAPRHFISTGTGVDKVPLENFIGEAVILDMSKKSIGEGITNIDLDTYSKIVKTGDIIISYVSMTSSVAGFIVENSLVIVEFTPFKDLLYLCLVFCLLLALLILP